MIMKKKTLISAALTLAAIAATAFAQDEAITITAPTPWMTLRGDSLEVSVQADMSRLPKQEVAFKLVRNANGRANTLVSKTVKIEDGSADAFLSRVPAMPYGGTDYLSLEWSVPGTEIKGVIEPVGAAALAEEPAPLSAQKMKDGVTDTQASDALAGAPGFEAGGVKFAAGWNSDALYVLIKAEESVKEVQMAIDGKCGKGAFLSWADRFIVYTADADSVSGVHYKRSIEKNAVKYEPMAWGSANSLTSSKAEVSRLIKIRWYELGLQPFEERNIGFAAFVTAKGKKSHALPTNAKRDIPGTWGDIRLEK